MSQQEENKETIHKIQRNSSEFTGRESKIIYYIINLIPMLILMIRFFSVRGFITTLILSGILLFVMIFKVDFERKSASYLSLIFFMDICIVIGIFSETLQNHIQIENLVSFWKGITIQTIICLCIGFVMGLISLQKEKTYWLSWVGAELVGIAVILQLFGNGDLLSPVLKDGGKEILTLFIAGAGIWFFLSQISVLFDWGKRAFNMRMGFVLLLAVLFLFITEQAYINQLLPNIISFYQNLSISIFAWWKVLLSVGIMVVAGIVLLQKPLDKDDFSDEESGIVCFLLATGILTMKLLLTNHFAFNWIFFCIFALISFILTGHGIDETLSDEEMVYLGVQPFLIIGAVKLLEWGLWINIVVTVAFALLFYRFYKNRKILSNKQRAYLFIYILIAIAAETIAGVWTLRFQADKMMMVGAMLAMSVCAIVVLNWPHPDHRRVLDRYKIGVCVMFGILCFLSINKYGSKITTDIDEEQRTISIAVDAKGKENKMESVTCIWTNQFGQQVGDEISFREGDRTLDITAETLTITAVDQNGVNTVHKERFPYWMIVSE